MTLCRMVVVGCLSLVGSALAACANSGAERLGEGNGNVDVSPTTWEDGGCTLTQGYWKNHEPNWPVWSLTIGGVTYSHEELLELFRTPPRGDASLILGHQLIAALLNVATGASDAALDGALAKADAWMAANKDADGRLPYGVKRGSAADEAVSLSGTLASFNEGGIGPGHCDDGPSSGSGSTGSGSGSTGSGEWGEGGSAGGEGGSHGGEWGEGGSAGGEGGSDGGEWGEGGSSGDPGDGEGGSGSEGPVCSDPCSDGCGDGSVCILGCCAFVPN
ncbi:MULTISPECIES: hypothetical protein [Sorangium]|uniref:Uncharacterized protein n=1 Tax=Sorangium cellulosum TaxID=56 RepID=A0A4P2R3F7_SORCE|nr:MULTISPECIES: hypothetical protein [Sorangium]AUX37121.1 hypothetical protein SOCE836_093420 [Sorangium cellulosum]WCQ96412.1 hypothetical protein NQZ70_09198 [Sorangium sp. Soce836]